MLTKNKINSLLYISLMFISGHAFAQCVDDSHSAFENQGWMSCQRSESAVKQRGKSHWIQYDLGNEYQLTNMRIWNHNVWGETGQGAKSIIVDYSLDGVNWASAGELDVEKAPGSWKYIAPDPIDLHSLTAKYVLITVAETWESNSACAGIAEVTFGVEATTPTKDEEKQLSQFKIFPNPASEQITLEFDNQESKNIKIVNAVGQTVREIGSVKKDIIELSIIDLEDGLYYIQIESGRKSQINSFSKFKN